METNFAKLLKELCSLRQEMKEEIVTLKNNANWEWKKVSTEKSGQPREGHGGGGVPIP